MAFVRVQEHRWPVWHLSEYRHIDRWPVWHLSEYRHIDRWPVWHLSEYRHIGGLYGICQSTGT